MVAKLDCMNIANPNQVSDENRYKKLFLAFPKKKVAKTILTKFGSWVFWPHLAWR